MCSDALPAREDPVRVEVVTVVAAEPPGGSGVRMPERDARRSREPAAGPRLEHAEIDGSAEQSLTTMSENVNARPTAA